MSSTVVHVKNISHQTSEKEVRDFFSFCGKITSLSVTPESEASESPKSATVTFEKETAAKTALLLDHTQLGPSQVEVSSAANISDIATSAKETVAGAVGGGSDSEITQEDKPRSRIVAEYLAHGYVLSDTAIQRAISLDQKHGVSTRFTNYLASFDDKYHASDKAKGIDASYGLTDKAASGLKGLSSYFEKAMGTPTGQKLVEFYTKGDKQVRDIHAEARRLADMKSGKTSSGGSMEANAKSMKSAGDGKTTCQCGGNDGTCPCAEGKCACNGCAKSEGGMGEHTATGKADIVADSSTMAPLGEKNI
ncbi:hypothetical protein MMC13_005841 [Lambiella insularis]|nr:hypothetical protein [Lambiella insularis]